MSFSDSFEHSFYLVQRAGLLFQNRAAELARGLITPWLAPECTPSVKETLSVIAQSLTGHLVSARLRDAEQEERDMQLWCSTFEKGSQDGGC